LAQAAGVFLLVSPVRLGAEEKAFGAPGACGEPDLSRARAWGPGASARCIFGEDTSSAR